MALVSPSPLPTAVSSQISMDGPAFTTLHPGIARARYAALRRTDKFPTWPGWVWSGEDVAIRHAVVFSSEFLRISTQLGVSFVIQIRLLPLPPLLFPFLPPPSKGYAFLLRPNVYYDNL